jgi:hypothetical protein
MPKHKDQKVPFVFNEQREIPVRRALADGHSADLLAAVAADVISEVEAKRSRRRNAS